MALGNGPASGNIAGIVLAGGASSRMGQDKALLTFRGACLLDHMIALLQDAGCSRVFVSGDRTGYNCIRDKAPGAGPGAALSHILSELADYKGILVVPVDMPLLTKDLLQSLLRQPLGGFFENWPLPAYIAQPFTPSTALSVRGVLQDLGIKALPCPERFLPALHNINTPDEFNEVLKHERTSG